MVDVAKKHTEKRDVLLWTSYDRKLKTKNWDR